MTEREICGSFRRAENQKQQIQILTELTCKSKYQIIGILLRNGEKVPKSIENQLYKRLDALDAQIFECEMEYKEIVTALTGENRRKEHGNRIQRHGRTEQEQYAQIAGHGYRILAAAMEKNLPYEIKCPALLMCGTQDYAGSCIRYNKAWHRNTKIPLTWIEGAGHNSNTDKPEQVNRLIEEFVADIL